jgi:hypothetical protein
MPRMTATGSESDCFGFGLLVAVGIGSLLPSGRSA